MYSAQIGKARPGDDLSESRFREVLMANGLRPSIAKTLSM